MPISDAEVHEVQDSRLRDFFWLKNQVVDDGHMERMGVNAWAVYGCYLRYGGNDEREAWPSVATLMGKTGLSKHPVVQAIRHLCDLQYLRRDQRGGPGVGSSRYTILELPPLVRAAPQAGAPGAPEVGRVAPEGGAPGAPDVGRGAHRKKTQEKKTQRRSSCTEALTRSVPTDFPHELKASNLTTRKVACWTTGKIVCFLPLVGEDNSWCCVTEDWVTEMSRAFPAINVKAELRRYKAWAMNNPTKRKTAAGIGTSLNTWFSKEQDRAGGAGGGRPTGRGVNHGLDIERRDNASVRIEARDALADVA